MRVWWLAAIILTALAGSRARGQAQRLESFDREMEQFMQARGVPGGALAVAKDGRLVYARGYGWADRDKKEAVRPESLFRIASISKPITGVAVLKLVEDGRLRLDDRAFELLRLTPVLEPGKTADPRLERITVRQLLQHTGGWDRDKSFDPMFRSRQIARAVGVEPPAGPEAVIRYMLGQPLDFDPGARYAYSNFGYCVLGRIIEKVSGMSYERYVKRHVLAPAGVTQMRLGASLQSGPDEVRYYTADNGTAASVFPGLTGKVPWTYGAFNLEAMDAHGGWIASAVDLVRLTTALDDPRRSPLRKPETLRALYARPEGRAGRKEDGSLTASYYAAGWSVRPVGADGEQTGKANYWHNGSLPGTATLLVRRWDGLTWAALFNQRSEDKKLPDGAIDGALHRAAAAVNEWPEGDLFPRYR